MMNRIKAGQNSTANQRRGRADRNSFANSDGSVARAGYCFRSRYHWTRRKMKMRPSIGINPTMIDWRASRTRFVAFLVAESGTVSLIMKAA